MDNKKLTKQIIKDYSKTFTDLGEYDKKSNKEFPVLNGLLKYFPNACLYVSHVSLVANEQHNPGTKMHWDKSKSIGEGDEIVRHLMHPDKFDTDGLRHLGKACWRSLELLEREIMKEKELSTDKK